MPTKEIKARYELTFESLLDNSDKLFPQLVWIHLNSSGLWVQESHLTSRKRYSIRQTPILKSTGHRKTSIGKFISDRCS